MKKVLTMIISLFLALLTLTSAMVFANAETDTSSENKTSTTAVTHTHSYKWVVTKKATTKKTGVKAYKCSGCGNIAKTAKIAKLKKLKTPTGFRLSTKYVKVETDVKYAKESRIVIKFNKVKNATAYKIKYKKTGSKKNYKTKIVKTNSCTLKNLDDLTKYTIKVAAITTKSGYANSSHTKVKRIKTKEYIWINICNVCGWKKNGKGKGYCETWVTAGYCQHCGKPVEAYTCHHCTVSNKSKDFWKYDHETGK